MASTAAAGSAPDKRRYTLLNPTPRELMREMHRPARHHRECLHGRRRPRSGRNDGPQPGFGDTALALMPFIKIPTGPGDLTNGHVEGGLILPLAVALPAEFDLGLMAEVDVVYDEAAARYGVDFVHTATVGHDVPGVPGLGAYVEYVSIAPHDSGKTYQAIASGGLTYAMSNDWVLDLGGTAGISDSADDVTAFTGTSFRY